MLLVPSDWSSRDQGLQRCRYRYRYRRTGISLPTPIPTRGIGDMTILNKDHYQTFAEERLGQYLEFTEHTKHYLHIMSMFVPLYLYYYT